MNQDTSVLTPKPHTTKKSLFLKGARDIIPLIIAAIPFGIVFGALAIANGLSVMGTMGMAVIEFAGSSQFVAATLLGAGAGVAIIVLTVFVVNLRHMLYSVSMMPKVDKLPMKTRIPMAFWLTDEAYATLVNGLTDDPDMPNFHWYYLGAAVCMYVNWQLCTALGIYLGQEIPDLTKWGLDIAMVVAFVGIVVPILKNKAQWACAITAFVTALMTHDWPHQTGLLISSLVAIGVGVLLSYKENASHE